MVFLDAKKIEQVSVSMSYYDLDYEIYWIKYYDFDN